MTAQEFDAPPAAIAEILRAVQTDSQPGITGAPPVYLSTTNGGDWISVDAGEWGSAVAMLHTGPETIDRATELVAWGLRFGGDLNAEALASGLSVTPIAVVVIDRPGHRSSEVSDIATWAAFCRP